MTGIADELTRQAEAWIADEVDETAAADLTDLLARSAVDLAAREELADRFAGTLAFGTAGLRGPLRPGPNGMNRVVVRRAAAGLAVWLTANNRLGQPVVVCFDARHGSLDFAQDSAAILAAAGFDARLLPGPLPTPVLAFAVRHLSAAAGVMVTASHNPPQDNGYKVYDRDGGQIVPPVDREIEAAIRAVGPTRDVALSDGYQRLGDEIVEAYLAAVAPIVAGESRDLKIVHTAMHGVGTGVVTRAFAAAGFAPLIAVPEQEAPDPDFPTLAFPNPEEPGALDLALALAHRENADVIIANDPDADRCAVAVPFPGTGHPLAPQASLSHPLAPQASLSHPLAPQASLSHPLAPQASLSWRMLRGDEVGVLLADHLMRRGVQGTYATTIVSSTMLSALAASYGVGYGETLTGFKWIVRAADDLVFGYEEALGYAVLPEVVRDKDGISAALLVADLAAELKAAGSSLAERLAELAQQYGLYATDQLSVRVADLSLIATVMARLRAHPPATLLDQDLTATDLLPDADVLTYRWNGGRAVVRPSGTEPKLKCYLEVVVADGSRTEAERQLTALRGQFDTLLAL